MQRIKIDPRDAAPLWRQVEDGVRQLIVGGVWGPGAAVPSVRVLAAELLVNPATVSRAYQRLVDAGALVVKRGEGTFVAAQPPLPSRSERLAALREAAERYAAAAASVGADTDEATAVVLAVFERQPRTSAAGGKR